MSCSSQPDRGQNVRIIIKLQDHPLDSHLKILLHHPLELYRHILVPRRAPLRVRGAHIPNLPSNEHPIRSERGLRSERVRRVSLHTRKLRRVDSHKKTSTTNHIGNVFTNEHSNTLALRAATFGVERLDCLPVTLIPRELGSRLLGVIPPDIAHRRAGGVQKLHHDSLE